MITCIRDVRRARGLTLQDVAERCVPPTTAQTIGRLETGTRTVSVGWLARIAAALGVQPADLVRLPDRADLPVLALVRGEGTVAPTRPLTVAPPAPDAGDVAILVEDAVGDFRANDVLWCATVPPERFAEALGCDVVVPRPVGRFAFGRLVECTEDGAVVLPHGEGRRRVTVAAPPWLALVRTLVRPL